MKVVEPGIWQNPWSAKINCSITGCGALLLVEEKDLEPYNYKGRRAPYAKFKCPICGGHTTVSNLPPRIEQLMESKRESDYYD